MSDDIKRYRKIIEYVNNQYNNIILNEKLPFSILKNNEELDYIDDFKNYVSKLFKKNNETPPELSSYNIKNVVENYLKEHGKNLPEYAMDNEVEAALVNLDFSEYGDIDVEKRALDFYSYHDSLK